MTRQPVSPRLSPCKKQPLPAVPQLILTHTGGAGSAFPSAFTRRSLGRLRKLLLSTGRWSVATSEGFGKFDDDIEGSVLPDLVASCANVGSRWSTRDSPGMSLLRED